MTVRKLIELLSEGNPDAEVAMPDGLPIMEIHWSAPEDPRGSNCVYLSDYDEKGEPGQKVGEAEVLGQIGGALTGAGFKEISQAEMDVLMANNPPFVEPNKPPVPPPSSN
jgi:hypothetical protein